MEEAEEKSVQAQIGELAALFLDFTAHHEMEELVCGGIAIAGRLEGGKPVLLTRTDNKNPVACMNLWLGAAELEMETMATEVGKRLRDQNERIERLEQRLRDEGLEP